MTSERDCFVYIMLPGKTEYVTAGRFRLEQTVDGNPVGRFVYGRRYLERHDAVEFDPVELRLNNKNYETVRMNGFFGAIRDSMPDYWGRRVIEKHVGQTQLEEFSYLMESADDRAGALGFGLNVEPPSPKRKFNRTLNLERLQLEAEAITNDDPSLAGSATDQVGELLLLGTSMGGARPKTVIEDDNALWLAKFSQMDDRWNQPLVEHAMLKLAKQCSIDVAHSRMTSVAGKDVLLVRRFDREWTAKGYNRHRMISALTLLRDGDNPAERYNWSYLLLADEIRRASIKPESDLRELFTRMCFNAIISNSDDHPRNHAMIATDKGWQLSPAYDLTPTPQVSIEARNLAMTCGSNGRYANKNNLLSEHGRFLLSLEDATVIINNIVDTVRSEWQSTMYRCGVTQADCEKTKNAFLYEGFFYESNS